MKRYILFYALLSLLSIVSLEAIYFEQQELESPNLTASMELDLWVMQLGAQNGFQAQDESVEHNSEKAPQKKRKRRGTSRKSDFTCPCGVTGPSKDFIEHLEQHKVEKKTHKIAAVYKCPALACAASELMHIKALKKHIRTEHMNKKIFACPHSPERSFLRLDLLNRHIRDKHMNKPAALAARFETANVPVTCPCGTYCANNETFRKHLAEHRTKTNTLTACPDLTCSETFKALVNLDDHIRTKHALQTIYKCKACNKEFGYIGSIRNHASSCNRQSGVDVTQALEEEFQPANEDTQELTPSQTVLLYELQNSYKKQRTTPKDSPEQEAYSQGVTLAQESPTDLQSEQTHFEMSMIQNLYGSLLSLTDSFAQSYVAHSDYNLNNTAAQEQASFDPRTLYID